MKLRFKGLVKHTCLRQNTLVENSTVHYTCASYSWHLPVRYSLHERGAVEVMKADFNLIMSDWALNVVIENSYCKYKCYVCTLTGT
jgi:hypothetical protein